MSSERLSTFLRREQDFSRGMKLFGDEASYSQSAALLGIHAAISYADALRTGRGDESLASDDHQSAVRALRSQIRPEEDHEGLRRFQRLLGEKSAVSYGPKRFDVRKLQLLCIESERFAVWANRIGRAGIAGWSDEDD